MKLAAGIGLRKQALVLLVALLAIVSAPGTLHAGDVANPAAERAREAISGLDFDDARRELAAADPDDPQVALERGRLMVYEQECDEALRVLSRPDVQKNELGNLLADIARGCARVTAATSVIKDDAKAIELRFQDDNDRALAPMLIDTIVKARDSLTRNLGVTWPKPTRFTIVRDLLSLSAVTGLPYQAATTTGTVAVAKWGRVTLLSPRASHHGYAWLDTITHELTHLAITRATVDRAPLWLQEGLAKREEVRWRAPNVFDERPSADAIAARGIELHLDLPLDGLGPSIAMLPSADQAMVAFSEVTSFIKFVATNAKDESIVKFLRGLREKKTVDEALLGATTMGLKTWEARWRQYLAVRPREPIPAAYGLGGAGANKSFKDLRERARLGELLIGRGHFDTAQRELDYVAADGKDDPRYRYLRARILEAKGDRDATLHVLGEPRDLLMSYGPFWAIRGRALSDKEQAEVAYAEGAAVDPYELELACRVLDSEALALAAPSPLCAAARTRREPALGKD